MGDQGTDAGECLRNDDRRSAPCPHCGSSDVVTGLRLNQNAEAGAIGLAYKTGVIFTGTELLHADLCRACGTVVRFFVKEPKRNWIQK